MPRAVALGLAALAATCSSATVAPEGSTAFEVLVGAGDIAVCGSERDEETAALLEAIAGTVFTAGDNVYPTGTSAEFADCYEPSWGRVLDRTRPAPGNHDYLTPGGAGYYGYFGPRAGDPAKGYYSYDVGAWHVVVLNSNVDVSASSPQVAWLQDDLDGHAALCTVAYWHHPRFSSGFHGGDAGMHDVWETLYAHGVDVVINGHDHDYERFAPQDPDGGADPAFGIRQFVAGTGGAALRPFPTTAPNSEVRNADTYGVLVLRLFGTRYEWEFVPVGGSGFHDSGGDDCH